MQTLNVQPNQIEAAKTQVQTQKTVKHSASGDGRFQAILESVKAGEKTEKKFVSNAERGERKNLSEAESAKKISKTESFESKSSIDKSEEKTSEEIKDSVRISSDEIKNTSGENQSNENAEKINSGVAKALVKNALDSNGQSDDSKNELTVELDAESMEMNVQALGLAFQNAVPENTSQVEMAEADLSAITMSGNVESDLEIIPENLIADEIATDASEINALNAGNVLSFKDEISAGENEDALSLSENPAEENQLASLESDSEKKSVAKNHLAETPSRVEKNDEGTFKITDLRGSESKNKSETSSDEKIAVQNESVKIQEDAASSLLKTAQSNILASDNQSAGASGSTFQQMLSQQIQYNAPEFAKAGNIILRDNNSGSINMILKPENLGNVKISLELSDKIINGQIVVHSKEAFEAFKQNLDTLRQAFRESGFDNANFNLSFADSGTGSFSQGRDEAGAQFMANKTYSNYAGSDEVIQPQSESTAYTTSDDYHVDVVA